MECQRLCAVYGAYGMSGSLDVYGEKPFFQGAYGGAQIYAVGRRNRRIYHLYGDPEHEYAGTGEGGDVYRDLAAFDRLCDRAFRVVRRGAGAFGLAQGDRHGSGDYWGYFV